MRISIICFTFHGAALCRKLMGELSLRGHDCYGFVPESFLLSSDRESGISPRKTSLDAWVKEELETKEGLLFIGAAGIAVRAIAPYIKDKTKDPAVVVMDEMGRYAVSLLSGHIGGANFLAREAAACVGAEPVITTATDIRGRFAVDLWAKEEGLFLSDMGIAKKISADILNGVPVGFFSDFPVEGELPEGLFRDKRCRRNLWITVKDRGNGGPEPEKLRLIPKAVILGIGCRRGVTKETISATVDRVLKQWNVAQESIEALATIDRKKDEEGLIRYAAEKGIPLFAYPAEALMETEGDYTSSSFVLETTGADNVCERAAMACAEELSGGGSIYIRKQAGGGVTVAAAVRDWKGKI